MSLNVNGVNGVTPVELIRSVQSEPVSEEMKQTTIETAEVQNTQQEEMEQRAAELQNQMEEVREKHEEAMAEITNSKYAMSESDMRALLVLMGSRGPTQSVEEIAQHLQKYKEMSKL